MDEFGVLVESIGFKANGRSAPMAKMKLKAKSNLSARTRTDSYSFSVDELDGIFRSDLNVNKSRQSQTIFGEDDAFGAPVSSSSQYAGIDLESVLSSSNNRNIGNSNVNSRDSGGSNAYHDLLGSKSRHKDHVDDLFGSSSIRSARKPEKKGPEVDDFIPGFGGAGGPANIRASPSHPTIIDDPFSVFESSTSQSEASWRFTSSSDNDAGKASVQSSFDDFTDFISASASVSKADGIRSTGNNPSSETTSNGFQNTDYLDEIFGGGNKAKSNKSSAMSQNPPFDHLFHEKMRPVGRQTSSKSSFSTKKALATANGGIDVSSLIGDISTSSEQFHEIEGESEERRRARLNRHMRTNARMAEALAEKNQRDLQSQREQEEKCRLAETINYDIKRWAAGKEGNLCALLSSLQEVLWPECGWRPASLTDMITSDSVKKVYKRATLYVHPDKVQQKGASLQQRYIAEKVFDILKEAWNKFSADELR